MNSIAILADSTARLAGGDFTVRTGLSPRRGELGRLIQGFDQLARNLEECEHERRRAHQALLASELRYRRLFETARDGIILLDAETGEVDDLNPFALRLLGYPREEFLRKRLWDTPPFAGMENPQSIWTNLNDDGGLHRDDITLRRRDGEPVAIELIASIYLVDGRRVMQCNIRDISKRKSLEASRNEYSRRLEVLSRRLVEAQEGERRRLARELHDEMGQALTGIQLNLQTVLKARLPKTLASHLGESLGSVNKVLDQVRDVALNLRPSMLDDLGLEAALQWLAHRQAAFSHWTLETHLDSLPGRLDPVVETECFRVAQEALTNVSRHASATRVAVELASDGQRIHLYVRDNGCGFAVEKSRQNATAGTTLGLLSMEERASLAGGKVTIESSVGKGTEVHAWFPLRWRDANDAKEAALASG